MEISTPGRVCLFGEHQDYLGLPVLAMAISLRSVIKSSPRNDSQVIIRKPDIGETEKFDLNNIKYSSSKDYFKSDPNESQMSISYDYLIETDDDEYESDFIN